jgi:hypothetical protein
MHDERDVGFAGGRAYVVVAIRQNGDVRVSEHEIRICRRETHPRSIERCAEPTRCPVLLAHGYSDLASPFGASDVTTDDE